MSKKVFIIHPNLQYIRLYERLGFEVADNIEGVDLVAFTGGEDVSPELYGAEKHPTTFSSPIRDAGEKAYFDYAYENAIPMVGICRGGQFLNVMSGGELYQNVSEHTRSHYLTDVESGEQIYVSSTHHQMFKPSENAIIIAVSHLGGEREWWGEGVWKRDISNTDYEAVFYPHTKCLCFQPHPEFHGEEYYDMKKYFAKCLAELMGFAVPELEAL